MRMHIVSVINQKGGVGKTTSVANIGAALATAGHKVLLVDLDPQAHLSISFDRMPDPGEPSVYT
ncbi:MAG: chromosome partitioning protein, partial [Myxococcota bacterium]